MLSNLVSRQENFPLSPLKPSFGRLGLSKNAVKTTIAEDVTSNLFWGRYSNLGSRVL